MNIFEDLELRDELKRYSNWPTYPQLYVNGELIGGCDITMQMLQSGELQAAARRDRRSDAQGLSAPQSRLDGSVGEPARGGAVLCQPSARAFSSARRKSRAWQLQIWQNRSAVRSAS